MTLRNRPVFLFVPFALVCLVTTVRADVKLASVFGDHESGRRESL
ncbi:MAG: hypothetical protein QF918_08905 [Pirellulaceae bacterium]|nr:hypothetical protein [Pirellulaceae bacterium]MDP6719986.1 hypothetical protein [Pirellulaceae bacterium]